MLSKLIKQKIEERFGKEVRYPKDCEPLANHISQACKTRVSASTLRRLYGFVKGIREPRLHTLDIVAEYLGHKGWEQLVSSFDRSEDEPEKLIDKLRPEQIKNGQAIQVAYEPTKVIEIRKVGGQLQVVSSNEKRVLVNDEVRFRLLELHYPLTFSHHFREGGSLGKLQLATVSGITSIKRI